MKKILVSACLLGKPCRYDGQAKPVASPILDRWVWEGRVIPFCPEVLGGLPVPRPECQKQGDRVMTIDGSDVTEAFALGGEASVSLATANHAAFCILKERSPSCGTKQVHDGTFSGVVIPGSGVAAAYLASAGYALFNEFEIAEAEAWEEKGK